MRKILTAYTSLQIVFSSTKMMAATVFAVAVDKGWLKYNDNVSKHWPEFAQNGKEHITIADVLRHDAGLNSFDSTISHVDHMDHENRNGNNAKIIAKIKTRNSFLLNIFSILSISNLPFKLSF